MLLVKVIGPLTVRYGSVTPDAALKEPPAEVIAPVPKAVLEPAITLEPDPKAIPPLKVLAPLKVSAPVPDRLSEPVPDIVLAKRIGELPVKLRVPLSVMAEVGVKELRLAAS